MPIVGGDTSLTQSFVEKYGDKIPEIVSSKEREYMPYDIRGEICGIVARRYSETHGYVGTTYDTNAAEILAQVMERHEPDRRIADWYFQISRHGIRDETDLTKPLTWCHWSLVYESVQLLLIDIANRKTPDDVSIFRREVNLLLRSHNMAWVLGEWTVEPRDDQCAALISDLSQAETDPTAFELLMEAMEAVHQPDGNLRKANSDSAAAVKAALRRRTGADGKDAFDILGHTSDDVKQAAISLSRYVNFTSRHPENAVSPEYAPTHLAVHIAAALVMYLTESE